jgi:outer membrane protein assembly factor BamD
MLRPRHLPVTCAIFLVLLAACAEKLAKQKGLSDADLLTRGQKGFAGKSYNDAVEAYQVLLERFPNSPYAGKAQLGLAEARMENKEYVEAEIAYDDFLRLNPSDGNVPYALYRKGLALASQGGKPGRDMTKTQEAVKAFALARDKDPRGPYAEKAAREIRNQRNILAMSEKAVVSHYLSRKSYDSAEFRARRAAAEYWDTDPLPEILHLLAEALEKQGKKEEAAEMRRKSSKSPPAPGKGSR